MEQNKPIDYNAVLADLEAKKAAIETAINGIKLILGNTVSVPQGQNAIIKIEPDAFFGMSIGDASKKYLAMMRRPQNTREIMEALTQGNLPHTAKDFLGTIRTTLNRQTKVEGDIVKIGENWALAEWYPGMRKRKNNKNSEEKGDETEGQAAEPETEHLAKEESTPEDDVPF